MLVSCVTLTELIDKLTELRNELDTAMDDAGDLPVTFVDVADCEFNVDGVHYTDAEFRRVYLEAD